MTEDKTNNPQLYVSGTALQSEEQLRLLVEYSRDLIFVIDRSGLIQYANPSILRTLGYLPEDVINRQDIIQIVHPEDRIALRDKITPLMVDGDIKVGIEARVKHRDGSWRTLDVEATNLLDNKAIKGVILNARDITEHIEANQKVQQLLSDLQESNKELAEEQGLLSLRVSEQTAQLRGTNAELARAVRTRDEFLANMSHELRTPLTSILGQAELLREGIHGELDAEQDDSVKMIQISGEHLLALINDILELVKIEAGRSELQMLPVLAETAAVSSAQIVQRQAELKALSVSLPSSDRQTYVLADERRFHQILVNLLSNAIKFTPVNGEIGIEIAQDSEQEAVHITVWDKGIGIRSEDMKLLFQPFTQLDASLDRHHEGTGLGLALVYQLTKMQGGSVAVESTFGEGSRFTVSLPQAEVGEEMLAFAEQHGQTKPQQAVATTQACENSPSVGSLQILLAEDNAGNIDTIVQYLVFRGHEVLVATNGGEAVALAAENEPDIIIMDMQMPVIDGLEATRQLRANQKLADTPVIALTGLAMPGDREACLAAGANAYMSKPISLQKLDSLIQELVQS